MWSERRRTMAGWGALCWMRLLLVVGVMCACAWASVPLVRLRQDAVPTEGSVGPLVETVCDDILPLNRWRRVHAALNEDTRAEIEKHLVEMDDQAHHHGHSRKHHHVHNHRRSKRQIQPQNDSSGLGKPVSFHFVNAAPGKGNISLSLQANQHGQLPGRNDLTTESMPYGAALHSQYRLTLEDHIAVQASNGETYRSQVNESALRIPASFEFLVVSDVTRDGRLQSTLAMFDLKYDFSPNKSWLFTYNAMLPDLSKKVVEGVDVILFDASKFGHEFSLHRIAKNTSLHHGQEALMPNGKYEVKVVPPNSVMDVSGFKNTKSLVSPVYVRLDNHCSNYLVISGSVTSQTYKPTIISAPDFTIVQASNPTAEGTNITSPTAYKPLTDGKTVGDDTLRTVLIAVFASSIGLVLITFAAIFILRLWREREGRISDAAIEDLVASNDATDEMEEIETEPDESV